MLNNGFQQSNQIKIFECMLLPYLFFQGKKLQANSGRLHPANLNGFDNGTQQKLELLT